MRPARNIDRYYEEEKKTSTDINSSSISNDHDIERSSMISDETHSSVSTNQKSKPIIYKKNENPFLKLKPK